MNGILGILPHLGALVPDVRSSLIKVNDVSTLVYVPRKIVHEFDSPVHCHISTLRPLVLVLGPSIHNTPPLILRFDDARGDVLLRNLAEQFSSLYQSQIPHIEEHLFRCEHLALLWRHHLLFLGYCLRILNQCEIVLPVLIENLDDCRFTYTHNDTNLSGSIWEWRLSLLPYLAMPQLHNPSPYSQYQILLANDFWFENPLCFLLWNLTANERLKIDFNLPLLAGLIAHIIERTIQLSLCSIISDWLIRDEFIRPSLRHIGIQILKLQN